MWYCCVSFMSYVAGVCAAKFTNGDFHCPHDDVKTGRLIAFVLYLTSSNKHNGGEFVWCPNGKLYSPEEGSLLLMRLKPPTEKMTDSSMHFVFPVSTITGGDAERRTITGWLATKDIIAWKKWLSSGYSQASEKACGWAPGGGSVAKGVYVI